jgi:hypothetical protein
VLRRHPDIHRLVSTPRLSAPDSPVGHKEASGHGR